MTDSVLNSDNSVARGIAAICGAVLLFSVADAFGKWFGMAGYHTTQIVFFRYLFGLLAVWVVVWHDGVPALRTKRPLAHVVRGVMMFCALSLFFRGLRDVPLAEGIAVAFTAPLFATAMSGPVLGEKVGMQRWAAVLAGFAGMLVMLRPGSAAFRFDALFIIASAFCFASVVLYTRRLSRTETNASMFTYSTITAGLCTVPFLTVTWIEPQGAHLWMFVMLGLVGGSASFLMIIAYRNAPAAVNAPFDYTALIWTTIVGWLVWRETPDGMVLLGALIVVAAGMFITYRETTKGRRKAALAKTPHR
ncbi:MAG: DMT family transporter [Rhizobiales bacterium]|nr:DMT family transporter [Hyphomicrobiales bacterium]